MNNATMSTREMKPPCEAEDAEVEVGEEGSFPATVVIFTFMP